MIDNLLRGGIVSPVMRHTRILAIAGLSTALLSTANAEIESGISLGYHSDYVYRGLNLGQDLVNANLAISGSSELADWNLGVGWNRWDTSGDNFDEFLVEASLSRSLCSDPFAAVLEVGIANHSYSAGTINVPGWGAVFLNPADRFEPFLGISTSLGALDLGTKVFWNGSSDDWAHDTYWEVTASYSVDMGANLSSTLSVEYGQWDTDPLVGVLDIGKHFSVTGAIHYAASDSVTLSAYVTHLLPDGWNLDDETHGGASVSLSF